MGLLGSVCSGVCVVERKAQIINSRIRVGRSLSPTHNKQAAQGWAKQRCCASKEVAGCAWQGIRAGNVHIGKTGENAAIIVGSSLEDNCIPKDLIEFPGQRDMIGMVGGTQPNAGRRGARPACGCCGYTSTGIFPRAGWRLAKRHSRRLSGRRRRRRRSATSPSTGARAIARPPPMDTARWRATTPGGNRAAGRYSAGFT